MSNLFKFVIVILLIACVRSDAQNLALHKKYTLSAPPNYAHAAPSTDKSSLTDGIYTTGYFWTKLTTVGWKRRQILIDIDLDAENPIDAVTFNTARRTQVGVDFPKNIFVFVSRDNKNFAYVGDVGETPDNTTGDYSVKKFILNNINTIARYVTIVVIPRNTFVFCDEVEVLKGTKKSAVPSTVISKENLDKAVDSLLSLEYSKNNLINIVAKLKESSASSAEINKTVDQSNAILSNKNLSEADLKKVRNDIFHARASRFRATFNTSFIVEKYNPWDSLSEFYEPEKVSDILSYDFTVLKNGTHYGSFVLTNSSQSQSKFTINFDNNDTSISKCDIFTVPFVSAANFSYVADPLILTNTVELNSGASQLFVFKISGKKSGSSNFDIIIQSESKKVFLKVKTKIIDLAASDNDFVNANVWAYLNYPMLKDRNAEAAKDLETHHINSIVIPPSIIQTIKGNDYTTFSSYLSYFKKTDKIFLFTSYSSVANKNKGGQFLSAEWKNNFIEWYTTILKVITENGFSNSKVYLYPYDEVGPKEVEDFKMLINWAKSSIPGIKFYATITNQEAANSILPIIDIAQIHLARLELLKNSPPYKCETWIYEGKSPARSVSPYTFYRLMAWKAFAKGNTGIGFWNYADEGPGRILNLISDNLSNPASSYSVIYDGPGKQIISTRRWEAFNLGIEDYAILKLYARRFGVQKAKELAQEVISNPKDVNKADLIRKKILESLQ